MSVQSSASAGAKLRLARPMALQMMAIVLMSLVFFIKLLCNSCIINISGVVGVADHATDEGSDNFGKGDDGEADEGVGNHVLSLFELAWVA